jgi:translation initiation factor 6 (eIF-6)
MAVDQDTKRGDRSVVASATTQDVGVLNVSGSLVNPATEEKQDEVLSSLSLINASQSETATRDSKKHSLTANPNAEELLNQILTTLKRIEVHLSEGSGMEEIED